MSTQCTMLVLIRIEKMRVVVARKKGNCQGLEWIGRGRRRNRRRMRFKTRGG